VEFKPKTRHAKPVRRARPTRFAASSLVNRTYQSEIRRVLSATGAQAKLTIGQPNDKYEQEADRVADQVMRMSDADVAQRVETGTVQPMRIQRMCPECEEEMAQRQPMEEKEGMLQSKLNGELLQRQPMEEEEEELQAKEMPGQTPTVAPNLESRINSLKGGGQPLDSSVRAFFEPRFGRDFSNVRVHTDSNAADTAKSIHARAFTLGNHVVMGGGEFQPKSQSGRRLLGHELTHVVQQNWGLIGSTNIQRGIGGGHDLKSPRFANNPSLEAAFDGKKYITNGASGDYVKKIQNALEDLGNKLPKYGADGKFGAETNSAVRRYQTSKTFQVDGIVGPETMGGLDRDFNGRGKHPTPKPVFPIKKAKKVSFLEDGAAFGWDNHTDPKVPWKSVKVGATDTVKAKVDPVDPVDVVASVMFDSSDTGKVKVTPEQPTGASQVLTITGVSIGVADIRAMLGPKVVGYFKVAIYGKKSKSVGVRLVHEKHYKSSDVADATLKNFTKKVYKQAVFDWAFKRLHKKTIGFDKNKNGEIDVSTWMTEEMKTVRDGAESKRYDRNVFIVSNPSDGSFGIAGFNQRFAYIFADSNGSPEKSFAHELGHTLGLDHKNSDNTNNMSQGDSAGKWRLRKDQWDQVNSS